MSLSAYFEQHEEQAFVAKALATAVAIILVKNFLPGLVSFLVLIFPLVFLIVIRMHAAASGVETMDLLREHITFFPMMRTEQERRAEIKPWVTYGIIFVNVLIYYGFEMNVPPELITDNLIFLPEKPDLFNVPVSAFTAMFLHAGGGHLWGNMTFLWVVGSAVERRVGRMRFFWLYLATGLIGGFVYILVEYVFKGEVGHALGASGAIAGIMGIFAVRCYFKSMIFPLPILGIFSLILPVSLKIRLNSLAIMALFFLADLSGGIGQITGESESMVGHWAHLGGMVAGMFLAGRLKLAEAAVEERHLDIGLKASEATIGYGDGKRSMQIVLERSPDNIDALLGMARLESKVRCTPQGKEYYEKALGLMPAARPAELVAVFAEYYAKYLSVPTDQRLVARLAEMLHKDGETELCIICLEKLVELPDTPPQTREKGLYQLATLLEFTSRFEAARSVYARFSAEYPDSVLAEKARAKAGNARYVPRPAPAPAPVEAAPCCPSCGAAMTTRPAKAGANRGTLFHVCSNYPACATYLPLEPSPEVAPQPPPPLPARQRYRLLFDGTVSLTADPAETRANLARLLRCGPDQLERLFSGQPVRLKQGLDHNSALRLKEAFDRTGAICTMEAEQPEPAVPSPAPVPDEAEPAATATPAAASIAPPQERLFVCPKCGHGQVKGETCLACGVVFAKLAERAERDFDAYRQQGGAARSAMSELHERRWAMWCHLLALSGVIIPFGNILGPLAIWLWKRKESEFVDVHGKTALNYQLTLVVFLIGSSLVALFTGFGAMLAGPFLGLLGLYSLAMIITAAVKSSRGDYVEIALSAEFIK